VRKLQHQIVFEQNSIKNLENDIKIYQSSDKEKVIKLKEEIKNINNEIEEIKNKIPKEWKEKNDQFKEIKKAYRLSLKQYLRNMEESYAALTSVKKDILSAEQIKQLIIKIETINNNLDRLSNIELDKQLNSIMEQTDKISGISNVSDIIYSSIQKIKDNEKSSIKKLNQEAIGILKSSSEWRLKAQAILPELIKYDEVIKDTIGLRSQDHLTKNQAIYVAKCNASHEDVSLDF